MFMQCCHTSLFCAHCFCSNETESLLFQAILSELFMHLGGLKKKMLRCQTVDIFTSCLNLAEGYFKTAVSEEPNACYFCCLWDSTLLYCWLSILFFCYSPILCCSGFMQCSPPPVYAPIFELQCTFYVRAYAWICGDLWLGYWGPRNPKLPMWGFKSHLLKGQMTLMTHPKKGGPESYLLCHWQHLSFH